MELIGGEPTADKTANDGVEDAGLLRSIQQSIIQAVFIVVVELVGSKRAHGNTRDRCREVLAVVVAQRGSVVNFGEVIYRKA